MSGNNLVKQVATSLIKVYQLGISPLLGQNCRYYPTCSNYAMGAIKTHGVMKGVALGSWRLCRCNPFSGGGFDPVPDRGRWLPDVHTDGRSR